MRLVWGWRGDRNASFYSRGRAGEREELVVDRLDFNGASVAAVCSCSWWPKLGSRIQLDARGGAGRGGASCLMVGRWNREGRQRALMACGKHQWLAASSNGMVTRRGKRSTTLLVAVLCGVAGARVSLNARGGAAEQEEGQCTAVQLDGAQNRACLLGDGGKVVARFREHCATGI